MNEELRNPDDARVWVLQGLWLSRATAVGPEMVRRALDWAVEIASAGSPLPLVGFVADVGHVALGVGQPDVVEQAPAIPGLEAGMVREYEDYVVGRLYADLSFERASDALLGYQGRDRARGVAFLVSRLSSRAEIGGAILSPAVLKRLGDEPAETILAEGWESIRTEGLPPGLVRQYDEILAAMRSAGDLLGAEDVFELERRTALAEFGQRLALRQVLQMAEQLGDALPHYRPCPKSRRLLAVATPICDEDTYPVGGFASIANRGSIESLLHSQLTYMEPDERPDLFDVRFVRDELLYYCRDENQFLRRRQTFVFALWPDLAAARFKDAALPYQRIVMVLGLLVAAVRKLIDWLSGDALRFEFLFLDHDDPRLEPEEMLVEMLLAEQVENGTVAVERIAPEALRPHCDRAARRSLCHLLSVSASGVGVSPDHALAARLAVDGPVPRLSLDDEPIPPPEIETAVDGWATALHALLAEWVAASLR